MIICDTCGKKFVRKDYYDNHIKTHTIAEVVEGKKEPAGEILDGVTTEVPAPEAKEEMPVKMVEDDSVTVRFTKPVEITINGIQYFGKIIQAKNMSIAAELIRIAREAYGPEVIA